MRGGLRLLGRDAVPASGGRLWAIVLAGGEGTRLRPLVRRIHGDERPKQFATLFGTRSMLRHTLDRASLAVGRERIVVIASRWHARYLASEFGGFPSVRLLLQPADRGTASGVLYPAHWIRRQDPEALVLILPSDHFVAREAAFMRHVVEVARWARCHPDAIVLVGARPTCPETEYGWIEPAELLGRAASGPIRRIRRFREKPSSGEARGFFERGGLWNTFVMVASVSALVDAGRRLLPELDAGLEAATRSAGGPEETLDVERAYAAAPAANFSKSILAACPPSLAVSEMPPVRWSDWGTAERVFRSIEEAGLTRSRRGPPPAGTRPPVRRTPEPSPHRAVPRPLAGTALSPGS